MEFCLLAECLCWKALPGTVGNAKAVLVYAEVRAEEGYPDEGRSAGQALQLVVTFT